MAGLMVLNGNGCEKTRRKRSKCIHRAADYGYEMARDFLKTNEEEHKELEKDTGFGFTAFSMTVTPADEEQNGKEIRGANSPKS